MKNGTSQSMLSANSRPDVRVRLVSDAPFFGPGTAELLGGVLQWGSVCRACEKVGLSYSKGRRMLRVLEQQLREPAVICTKGGTGGGSARLTETGRSLLEKYRCYEFAVRRYAEQQFDEYFSSQEGGFQP